MATQEVFGQICRRVCQQQGWELLPSGVQITFADGRHQLVSLEFFESEREELVRLYTTIGAVDGMDARRLVAALRINARLAHGALAVRDDALVMIDTLMLEDADAAEIEASIAYLAETADYYEKVLFGTDEY
ncbi:MAG: hypothetical protein JSU66_12195 [Deltaproteobacteria bacterium]|nr:MAG: hypothetical protein JSU66_12195 [Deltaproteobacteria bacterium]